MRTQAEQRMERTSMLLSEPQMERLRHAHIMLFGLGGVGSYAAEALGRMGIGTLTLVDGDRYAASNCNRQLCAMESTVGESKAEVTAKRLRDINPDATIIPIEQFYLPAAPVPIPDSVDFVVDAIDTVSAKLHIIETCRQKRVPIISCMGMGNRLDPTKIQIGDLFQTSNCALCRVMRKELRKRGIETLRCVYSTEDAICMPAENGRRAVNGSVAYVPSVAGLYLAYDVVQTLCNPKNERETC